MLKKLSKLLLTVLVLITFISLFSTTIIKPTIVQGSLEDDLRKIEEEIRRIREEKESIQGKINNNNYLIQGYSSQASKLYGEVAMFQKDIDELELQVKELEINIELLEKNINKNKKDIATSEKNIDGLEKESLTRIKDNYINFRLNGSGKVSGNTIFKTENINEYFKDSQYVTIIQEDTNIMLRKLAELKELLDKKRAELREKLLRVNKDKQQIEIKRNDLAKKRDEIKVKMAIYYAEISAIQRQNNNALAAIQVFSEEEARKQADAEAIRVAIFNNFNPVGNGQLVATGRPIGNQGCTGLCTGPHLHFSVQENGAWKNPCAYLPPGPVSGCGGGNRLKWPVSGTVYYTSAFGNRCFQWGSTQYCDFHSGADFAAVPANAAVYAAHNGYAYKGVDPYGANYVIICEVAGCGSGLKTGYWHLSNF